MTIYQRIIILVLVLVLGTGLTAAIFFNRVLHAELDHDVAGRAVTIAAAMTESATSAVVTGDVLSGQDLVKRSIRRLPGVEYIYFTGFDENAGAIIHH